MNKKIVLFDSTCRLCSNSVRFITKFDRRDQFCFIPLGSERAMHYLKQHNGTSGRKGTMMLITTDRIYVKSDAVLRILRSLDGLWPLLSVFLIIPRFLRDPVYDLVAKYRFKIFGPCVDCPEYKPC